MSTGTLNATSWTDLNTSPSTWNSTNAATWQSGNATFTVDGTAWHDAFAKFNADLAQSVQQSAKHAKTVAQAVEAIYELQLAAGVQTYQLPDNLPPSSGILRRAAALIREHGWIQGGLGKRGRGFCALGAILEAYRETGFNGLRLHVDVLPAARALEGYMGTPVAVYNDTFGRTAAEVIACLEAAADQCEAAELREREAVTA